MSIIRGRVGVRAVRAMLAQRGSVCEYCKGKVGKREQMVVDVNPVTGTRERYHQACAPSFRGRMERK